jgi:hypothetical protein
MDDSKKFKFERGKLADRAVWWKEKACIVFGVQTVVGMFLLAFCAVSLWTVNDCNKEAPYWGLIGTLCGFFFRKVASEGGARGVSARNVQTEDGSGSSTK